MEIKIYNTSAKAVGNMELNDVVFAEEYRESLIHQVVLAQLANKRQGTKSTLTRSEVRGGGAKPWRQKGTGRARQGSIRAPQWIKGGVVFAPKPRDFSQKINKQMKKVALRSALSQKLRDEELIVLKDIKLKENKTKEVAAILKNFKHDGKALFVLTDGSELIVRAANNIANLSTTNARLLNVYDVVANAKVFVTADAIKVIEEVNA